MSSSAALREIITRRGLKSPEATFVTARGQVSATLGFEGKSFVGVGPDRLGALETASRKALESVATDLEVFRALFELPPTVIVCDASFKQACHDRDLVIVVGEVPDLLAWHPMRRDAFEHLKSCRRVQVQLSELQGVIAWLSGRGLAVRPQFHLSADFDAVLRELGF